MLITLHYFNQRPLWGDEVFVLNNIQQLDVSQIFSQKLLDAQQFPKFYLTLIQSISSVFDSHVLSLRFLPFIFMSCGFFIWLRIAGGVFSNDRQKLTFIFCWAASLPLIYYAAELKQYSMDVLSVGLFILFLTLQDKIKQQNPRLFILCLAVLPLLGFFSYAVFLMFILPLVNMVRIGLKKREAGVYLAVCLAVVLSVYWFDMRISNSAVLRDFWKDYFISFASPADFFKTFGEGINNLVSRWFAEAPKSWRVPSRIFMGLGLVYMVISFWGQFKKDGYRFISVTTIAFILFWELFILGCLKVYAFSVPRTSLFFAPMLFCAAILALEQVKNRGPVWVYWLIQMMFWVYLLSVSIGIGYVIFGGDLGAQSPIWLH